MNRAHDSWAAPARPDLIATTPASNQQPNPPAKKARLCLACAYNLQGLGDEPRCPECGLLNISEGYRQQVWELVDSGRWFFSSFLGVFCKRPPGWWWSLDRPGDVGRAFRRAALYAAIAAFIVICSAVLASCVQWRRSVEFITHRYDPDPNRPEMRKVVIKRWEWAQGILAEQHDVHQFTYEELVSVNTRQLNRGQMTVQIRRPTSFFPWSAGILILLTWSWVGPSCLGLWTQLRKGISREAKARRTIVAATLYEAHRLIYAALLAALILLADATLRLLKYGESARLIDFVNAHGYLFPMALIVFGCIGWIGPLRSDHTRCLVRSPWHAARIIILYGGLLFWLGATMIFTLRMLVA